MTAFIPILYHTIISGIIVTRHHQDGGVTAAKRSEVSASGILPASFFSSTGNKNITGLGFKPKRVEFLMIPSTSTANDSFATGFFTESHQVVVATITASGSSGRNSSTSDCIGYITSSGSAWLMRASGVSMNSDGFTINVSVGAATFDIAWFATA